ncbi:MAG: AraC family transcriptional regulator [Clostridia bacterium]|nr:AraC family transcriptional regulator [Clostridia bacterium]
MNVDLNQNIRFSHAGFREFKPGETHLKRYCVEDVLIVLFSGVLRFSENGEEREVTPGHYYVQHHDMEQDGPEPSDVPKYFFIHFRADYVDEGGLPPEGEFDYEAIRPLAEELNVLEHSESTLIEKLALFYRILSVLKGETRDVTVADRLKRYLTEHCTEKITLDSLSERFGYSKNRIISIIKENFGKTPIAYINDLRLNRAKQLIDITADPLETIAYESGFGDYSEFYKLFVKKTGASPGEWKRMSREGKVDAWRK